MACLLPGILLGSFSLASGAPPARPAFAAVRPILIRRCAACHGAHNPEANLDLTRFTTEASLRREAALARTLVARIASGQMPPPGAAPLRPSQKRVLLAYINGLANQTPIPAATASEAPTLRRLTRYEYDRTIHDLLGLDFDSQEAVGLTDQPTDSGFDNQAAALNVSPALMDKYMTAADRILDRIIAVKDGKVAEIGNLWQAQDVHNRLFAVTPEKAGSPREAAKQILGPFVSRAWRRPATAAEVEALLRIYDGAAARGRPFEQALRPALKAVLVSPCFLFRVERAPAGPALRSPFPADDYALASRLSYFLWGTMPDATLFDLAAKQKLSDLGVLEQQARRMLADPKARALTERFAAQWLHIDQLARARPSTDFFPSFTPSLREAMYNETTAVFDRLRAENRSLLELLDADYTYVNEELAQNYGLKGVQGNKIQLVSLRPEDHRGGLLGMGSVLAMTSHTYRTSPTLRGRWVLDVIFGTPPPPPPPGVSVIADEQKKQTGGTTFHALLAQHASNPACAGCHHKMDPLGFALENYDAIGRWRDRQGERPLDTSAQLPTGEKLNGALELKRLILQRKEQFITNVTRKMLVYALGRELEASDQPAVQQTVADLAKNQYRFAALITDIICSEPFRSGRRGGKPALAKQFSRSESHLKG